MTKVSAANEKLYDALTYGIHGDGSLSTGKKHSPTIQMIDLQTPPIMIPFLRRANRRNTTRYGQVYSRYCVCFCEWACLGRDRGEASVSSQKGKAKAGGKSSVLGKGVSQSIRTPAQDQIPHLFAYVSFDID